MWLQRILLINVKYDISRELNHKCHSESKPQKVTLESGLVVLGVATPTRLWKKPGILTHNVEMTYKQEHMLNG